MGTADSVPGAVRHCVTGTSRVGRDSVVGLMFGHLMETGRWPQALDLVRVRQTRFASLGARLAGVS